jgi:hypothetical protein
MPTCYDKGVKNGKRRRSMRKKITTQKKTARQKTSSKKTRIQKRSPAVKKKAVSKPAEEETILSKIKNVVDDTAAKMKTLLPTGTTTSKESDQPKTK